MNAEQKKRIAHEISNWKNACNCRAVQLTGDRMAALLQELIDAPTPSVPDGLPLLISGAIYDFAGFLTTREKTIQVGSRVGADIVVDLLKEWAALRGLKLDDAAVLSWQEWLSPTPPAPSVPEVATATNPSQISSSAELPTWENGDDPLVGGGLISRGKVDFTALGIWPSKPAPEPEPVAWQVRNGWASVAIYQRQIDADNYAADQQKRHDLSGSLASFCVVPLYTAPPAPSVPEVATATNPSQISSSAEPFGYFKAEPFGWTDCAETDDGAIALYTAPPAPSVPDGWKHDCAGILANDVELWVDSCPHCGKPRPATAPTPAEAPADVARDAELLRKLKHSIGQAKVSGNDWRRELDLMSSMIDTAVDRQGGES